jgi:hypothetical protein
VRRSVLVPVDRVRVELVVTAVLVLVHLLRVLLLQTGELLLEARVVKVVRVATGGVASELG